MRFAGGESKLTYIDKIIHLINKIRFLSEIAWENKLITTKEFSELVSKSEEIGRALGGWKKGLKKTPTMRREKL